ncbi:MAG TPA: hypothetical protein VN756_03595, partial [Solirubrobacterales bacterium]|nr:hypothetical protein [Solirubrobacterales bacterium]
MRSQAKAATAGSNLRRTGAARLALICVPALLLVALFAAPAQAQQVTVAEFGHGAGQVSFPVSVAVDQSNGDFYVADANNARVLKFDAANEFRLAWGYGVRDGKTLSPQTCGPEAVPPTTRCFEGALSAMGPGAINPEAVAVDQSSHDVYVVDSSKRRVSKFTSSGQFVFMIGMNVNKTKEAEAGATQAEKNICTAASGDTCGKGASGTGPNEFSNPRAIAVDSSGVVWVGDTDRLTSFSSSGAAGSEIALPGGGDTSSLALDSSGNFYVKSESLPGIRKLEAGTGTLLETFDAGGQAQTAALDQAGNVYVGDATSPYRFKVYNPAGEQTAQFGAGQVIGTPGDGPFGGNAIAVSEGAGKLYAASTRTLAAESVVQAFPLPEPGPLPENQHVTDLEPTTVTLAAELNPEGDETAYFFEWGTSESYGHSTPTETLPGSAFESEAVQAALSGLIPNTTYHFRLVATNHCKPAEPSVQCTAAGPDTTFTTLPAVAIDAQWATDLTANSAVLHAELDPLGVAASWWIEWGTTASYGQSTPESPLPASFGDIAVATPFFNLTPGTTYHYRFVARDERDGNV